MSLLRKIIFLQSIGVLSLFFVTVCKASNIYLDSAFFRKISENDTGSIHLFVKNSEPFDVFINAIEIDGKKLSKANSEILWYQILPNPIPVNGISEITIKLAEPVQNPISVKVDTSESITLKTTIMPVDNPLHLTFVGFDERLDKAYIYLENVSQNILTIDKVYIDSENVTKNGKTLWRVINPLSKTAIIINLTSPLTQGKYIVVKVLTKEGIVVQSLVRVFSFFPITLEDGTNGNDPILNLDKEAWIVPFESKNVDILNSLKQFRPEKRIYYTMACPTHAHGSFHESAIKNIQLTDLLRKADIFHPNLIHPCGGGEVGCPEFAETADIVRINPNVGNPQFGRFNTLDWHHIQWRTRMGKVASEPRPLYMIASIRRTCNEDKVYSLPPHGIRQVVYYGLSRGVKGVFYRVDGLNDEVKKEIGKINGEIRFIRDLLKIGEPMQLGNCSEPLVEPATILCGDKSIILILINHNLDFKEEKPICEEYYPPISITNDFLVKVQIPPGIDIQDVFEVGNRCGRVKFIKDDGYINIVVDGIEITRQYVLTTDPQLYYHDSNRNGKSDLKEVSQNYMQDEFDVFNSLRAVQENNNIPDIQFLETQYNFGTIDVKDKVIHKFIFRNVGKNDLTIKDIVSKSSRIDAKAHKKILLPGEESNIEITMDTGENEGMMLETIYVYTNDIDEVEVKLQVGGTVKKSIVYSPNKLYFEDIQMDKEITKKIKILDQMENNLRITKIESSSEYIICEELGSDNKNSKEIDVKVILKPDTPSGEISADIKIYTNSPKWPVLEIPVIGRIKDDIQVFPINLFFGIVKKGTEVTRGITILFNSKKKAKIVGIGGHLDYISIDSISKKGENEYEVIARLKSNVITGVVKGDLIIQTNISNQTIVRVPFYALVE